MYLRRHLYRMTMLALFLPRITSSFRSARFSPLFRRQRAHRDLSSLSSLTVSDDANANPTLEWKGSSHSTSEFVTHVLMPPAVDREDMPHQTFGQAVELVVRENQAEVGSLTAHELLAMGSVWYLPACAPKDPSLGTKPARLRANQYHHPLAPGDYLRVHHHPRRFQAVYDYDWNKRVDDDSDASSKPGVIVEENKDKGWLVIDKPARVPVHMTVDNCRENVQACLVMARQKDEDEPVYISTPQRLDQNTSGLLVVATSPAFAAYFASLLRNKTSFILLDKNQNDKDRIVGSVHKIYKCLVCLVPPPVNVDSSWSVAKAWGDLQTWANEGTIIRHYLEPSIRAPKAFVTQPPVNATDKDAWLESLLRIKSVGPLYSLIGNEASERLAQALWWDDDSQPAPAGSPPRMPKQCLATTEITIELLTGRTHQIRGQLAAMGLPLVGDVQYGGAKVLDEGDAYKSISYERLALQCCELEFVDPDIDVDDEKGVAKLRRSNRWNKFRLDLAWWTPSLEEYNVTMQTVGAEAATTDAASDIGLVAATTTSNVAASGIAYSSSSDNAQKPPRPELLPDRVQLSPGKNKYVLVRASHSLEPEVVHWFVKSASPAECGGPYHGNVAQDLREWIEAAGYDVVVTGGGRIDFSPDQGRCVVYGFSYGFGKANHALAAQVIRQETNGNIQATHDNTDGLY